MVTNAQRITALEDFRDNQQRPWNKTASARMSGQDAYMEAMDARISALEAKAHTHAPVLPPVDPPPVIPPVIPPTGTLVPATSGALAAAITAAAAGATLLLRGGDHVITANQYVRKSLTLRAYPGEAPVITAVSMRPNYLYFTAGTSLVAGVGFRVGAATPAFDDSMGSAVTEAQGGAKVTYEDCWFEGNANMVSRQQIIYGYEASDITVRRCRIDGKGGHAGGVHCYHDPGGVLLVEDSTIVNTTGVGVVIDQTGLRATVRRNVFDNIGYAAIQHVKSGGSTVIDNRGTRCARGVQDKMGSNLTQSGNVWT